MAAQPQAPASSGKGYEANWAKAFGEALRPFRTGGEEWVIRLIDGPNMRNIGPTGRDMRTYGTLSSLGQLHEIMAAMAAGLGVKLEAFTSDHEGDIVRFIYETSEETSGYLINPAGVNMTGQPTVQALSDGNKPVVEMHFANVNSNGWDFGAVTCRQATAQTIGMRHYGYLASLFGLVLALDKNLTTGARL